VARYAQPVGSFVTAVYGIYDPSSRELMYSSAGHNPPRLKRAATGTIEALDRARSLPLGIAPDAAYEHAIVHLQPGDQIVFYTDGITEAADPTNELFGVARLDAALARDHEQPAQIVAEILDSVAQFTTGQPATDDRTLVVATVD
jgi:sigma-B regulation protein RsbU (phosphoserine phosphatase)